MLRLLCFLFLFSYLVPGQQIDWNTQIKNRPFSTGTAAPASSSCDASSELNTYYLQTGNPATIITQVWVCSQTGASSYAWQPISHKVGTTAPTTCTVGQVFFDSDATSGENWMLCTATDTWTAVVGGSGSSQFTFTYTGATTLSISAGTTVVGHEVFSIAPTAACTLTASAGDIGYFYLKDGIHYAAFSDSGSSVSCGSWVSITGISAVPNDAVGIYKWTASSTPGNWDTSGGSSYQGSVRADIHKAGNGLSESSDVNGVKTLAINTANVSQFTSSTSNATGSCTVGQVWINTSSNSSWDCTATDTWTQRGNVTPDSTTTFTNKTLDVEGTGNNVTTIDMRSWPAAKCQNGAAGASANLPATYSPTPVCITGTNVLTAALRWPDADGDYSIQDSFKLPTDWSGYVNFYLKWRTSATSGDIVWQLSTACVADGETLDPSFNTAQTVTDTAKGTANQLNDANISTVTMTGCAAGETLYWKLLRNRTHASDTLAAAADLLSYTFRIRRMQ